MARHSESTSSSRSTGQRQLNHHQRNEGRAAEPVIPAAVVCPRCERAGRVVEIMGGHYNVLGSCAHVVGIDRAEVTE